MRSAKVAANKEAFALYGDAVEIVGLDDLVKGSYEEILTGEVLPLMTLAASE